MRTSNPTEAGGPRDLPDQLRDSPELALVWGLAVESAWPNLRHLLCPRCRDRGWQVPIDPEAALEGYALCHRCWLDTLEGRG